MHRNLLPKFRRNFCELADRVRLVHAHRQIMRHTPFEFGLLPFAEQQQRRGDAAFAQVHRLFKRAQAKTPRAFLDRDARYIKCAVAVSLVLDDSHQANVLGQIAANQLQIAPQLAEINLGPGRPQWKIFRI